MILTENAYAIRTSPFDFFPVSIGLDVCTPLSLHSPIWQGDMTQRSGFSSPTVGFQGRILKQNRHLPYIYILRGSLRYHNAQLSNRSTEYLAKWCRLRFPPIQWLDSSCFSSWADRWPKISLSHKDKLPAQLRGVGTGGTGSRRCCVILQLWRFEPV